MDHYAMLGVSSDASTEEIERAYKERLHKVHPDLAKDPRDLHRRTKATVELNKIIATLRDPVKRAAYDQILQREAGAAEARQSGGPAPAPPRPEPDRPQGNAGGGSSSKRSGSGWTRQDQRQRDSTGSGPSDSSGRAGRDQPGSAAAQPEPSLLVRLAALLPPAPVGRVALGLGLILVVAVSIDLVLPIVAILLLPTLLPPFRASSFRGEWRVQSAGWLLIFEASLPGISGVALIATGSSNPQYVIVGSLCIGVALFVLVGAGLVLSKQRLWVAFGATAAIVGLLWTAILLYALPIIGGGNAAGSDVAAWALVPVVVLGLLASLVRSPAAIGLASP